MVAQCPSAVFDGLVALDEGFGHVGIGDSFCSGDQPGDEVGAARTRASGRLRPAVNPSMQNRSHVASTRQRPALDELREDSLDVESARCMMVAAANLRPAVRASERVRAIPRRWFLVLWLKYISAAMVATP
jgi:hypothetical protein